MIEISIYSFSWLGLSHNKVVLSEAGALFPIRSPTHPPTEKGGPLDLSSNHFITRIIYLG